MGWLAWILLPVLCFPLRASDWTQFRGPNGSGLSDARNLPVEFSPTRNVIWRTAVPPGHSSPVLGKDRIFLTAVEDEKLLVIALDRTAGRLLWKNEVPRPRRDVLHKSNHPASPSPVTDGANVYAFFQDFGLISFDAGGKERWRLPLGPHNNPFGMGASPILAGDNIIQACDAETGSFLVAAGKDSGKVAWLRRRPEFTRGFSTPVLYKPPDGPLEVLLAGSYNLTSYSVATGEPLWWVGGLTWQLKPTPVMSRDTIYILGWAGGSDTGQQEDVPDFQAVLAKWDMNKDKALAPAEVKDPKLQKEWNSLDLDRTGLLEERDWKLYQSRRKAVNGVMAVRLGGRGDMTEKSLLWRYSKSLPNVPSPLLYEGILYLVKEGGILTALDAKTGDVLKQGRITGAPGDYFSSPVAADGKIFTVSHAGNVAVIKPGAEWEIMAINEFGEDCNATPAFVDERIYLRTHATLYCLGTR